MKNPKEVLTEDGFKKLIAHLENMKAGVFYILNHADDLNISEDYLERLYEMQTMLDVGILEKGDSENV